MLENLTEGCNCIVSSMMELSLLSLGDVSFRCHLNGLVKSLHSTVTDLSECLSSMLSHGAYTISSSLTETHARASHILTNSLSNRHEVSFTEVARAKVFNDIIKDE